MTHLKTPEQTVAALLGDQTHDVAEAVTDRLVAQAEAELTYWQDVRALLTARLLELAEAPEAPTLTAARPERHRAGRPPTTGDSP